MTLNIERFWASVEKTSTCWLWKGSVDQKGYGYANVRDGSSRAHRVAYVLIKGNIPEGLQLDHICRVRNCVNPLHLEAVTRKENILRGIAPSALNARKTHCNKGHPFEGKNLYINKHGERECRKCKVIWQLAYLKRKNG